MPARVYLIPGVLAVLALAGAFGADLFSVPTYTRIYDERPPGETARAILVVEGVRCYGTAEYLGDHIQAVPGLVSLVAYAGKHRVVVEYSAQKVELPAIIEAVEAPITVENDEVSYFRVLSWERGR